jgi:hypothetical protein
MIENENLKSSPSLNKAFELILRIFNEERTYYETTISTLKGKVSELEESLLQVKKENMNYQTRISKLKGKLRSISKTVSKIEDSDFEIKIINNKESEKDQTGNNMDNFNTIKYRNTENINSFRRKSKVLSDTNKNKLSQNYIKMNTIESNKINTNGENGDDIRRNFKKKTHKKTMSTKIKNSILNMNQQSNIRKKNDENTLLRSHINDEEVSFFLINNLNENNNTQNKLSIPEANENEDEKIRKFHSRDKYNKIEQKIKGLKSALSIYNKSDNLTPIESFPNSVNAQSVFVKSNPYII